jgi:hypothetical protein
VRALILPDRQFALRERAMLARLEIGLADEGVRVLHARPASTPATELSGVFSTALAYADHGVPFSTSWRAADLLEAIDAAAPVEQGERLFDVVHCYGKGSWRLGAVAARAVGAALALEAFDADTAAAAVFIRTNRDRPAGRRVPGTVAVAADEPLRARLARGLRGDEVAGVPWGVHVPDAAEYARPKAVNAIAIIASGRQPEAVRAMVTGIAAAVLSRPELMLLADAELARSLPLWKWCRKAGIAERLSVVADLEGRRDMVLQADALLLPEAIGEQRSLVLEAMAAERGVLVVDDPQADPLHPTRCGVVEAPAGPAQWASAFVQFVDDVPMRQSRAAEARRWVAGERLASTQVKALLAVYDRVVGRLPVAMESGAGERMRRGMDR